MNDEDTTPRSGSRWEPEGGADDTAAAETDEVLEQPSEPQSGAPAPAGATEGAPNVDRKERFSGRTALAGAGIGLAAISGVAGFAIGHATADDSGRVGSYALMTATGGSRDRPWAVSATSMALATATARLPVSRATTMTTSSRRRRPDDEHRSATPNG